jgi:hypothetical protein
MRLMKDCQAATDFSDAGYRQCGGYIAMLQPAGQLGVGRDAGRKASWKQRRVLMPPIVSKMQASTSSLHFLCAG